MAVLSETKGTQWSLIAYEMLYDKSRNLLASRFDINEYQWISIRIGKIRFLDELKTL